MAVTVSPSIKLIGYLLFLVANHVPTFKDNHVISFITKLSTHIFSTHKFTA